MQELTAAGPPADDEQIASWYRYDDGETLRANMIMSADGAAVGGDGLSKSIAGPADTRLFSVLRALSDAVIVGAETLRKEHYNPIRTRPSMAEYRAMAGLAPHPRLVMVTRHPKQDRSLRSLAEAPVRPLVLCESDNGALSDVADVVELPAAEGGVDLVAAKALLSELGMRRLLTEGGPGLLAQFLALGLLDEYCLTVAPLLLGGGSVLRPVNGAAAPTGFALLRAATADGFVFLRYRRQP